MFNIDDNSDYLDYAYEVEKSDWEENFIKDYALEFCHECEFINIEHTSSGSEIRCILEINKNPPENIADCKLEKELLP